MKRPTSAARPTPPAAGNALGDYFQDAREPLASLLIVLPLVIFYEVGTAFWATDVAHGTEVRIVAYSRLRDALAAVHATATWLPPATVIALLAGQWAMSVRNVRPRLTLLGGMVLEGLLLALPLLGLAAVMRRYPLMASEAVALPMVLAVGAGVYEELIFRLIGVTALHALLVDGIRLRPIAAWPTVILLTAVAFALYHYWGPERLTMQSLAFRTAAGIYLGAVFAGRGFGITVVAHTAYDLAVQFWR